MPRRKFDSESALQRHAKLTADFYAWEATVTFVKWKGLLSPEQYEMSQGVRRAMIFPKAILRNWAAADGPLREALRTDRDKKGKQVRSVR